MFKAGVSTTGSIMWRSFFILSAFLIPTAAPTIAPAAEPLSPPAFTAVVARAAAAALPSATVTVAGVLHLETRSAGGETTTTDLHNAYEVYRADRGNLDDVVRRYVGVLAEAVRYGDAKAAIDRSRIVALLKPQAWVDGLRPGHDGRPATAPEPLSEPFTAELAVVYAEDLPTSLRYLTSRDDVGDRAKLRDLALENLQRLVPKIAIRSGADGVLLIDAGGTYEASLLLADELWSGDQFKVDGDIVVAVPARDVLVVTGSRNRTAIARLRALAAELATGPYALTAVLYAWRGGRFVKFDGN